MLKRKVTGILGGGQLARMSAFAALRMGFDVAVAEKFADSPAGMLTKNEFTGDFASPEVINGLCGISDIITLENEFIEAGVLKMYEDKGIPVFPSSGTIGMVQDKLMQKETFRNAGLPLPKFVSVTDKDTYESISEVLGKKFVLKSRTMGYDGYGNTTVRNRRQFAEGMEKLSSRSAGLMAEEFIDFKKELAVMIAVNETGRAVYPVVETIQENHICKVVKAPASVDEKTAAKVKKIALKAVKAINGKGIFGLELFIDADDNVFINEIAPRPHNSGHYTIEGCVTSQFENHIRAVLGLPLGSTDMVKPHAVMVNILGRNAGPGVISNYPEILQDPGVHLHFYSKAETRKGRKIGHITVTGDNPDKILKKALRADKILKAGIE